MFSFKMVTEIPLTLTNRNNILVQKIRVPKNLGPKSSVKIGSEAAGIILYGQMSPGQMLAG